MKLLWIRAKLPALSALYSKCFRPTVSKGCRRVLIQ